VSRSISKSAAARFLKRRITLRGKTYKYQVYLPPGWVRREKRPVILFLHGAGERGTDGELPMECGLPVLLREEPERFPFIVVVPQCPLKRWWTEHEMERLALAALSRTIREFGGDAKRVTVTGLSMGGYGSLDLAARFPKRFAAVVGICGGVSVSAELEREYPELIRICERGKQAGYSGFANRLRGTPVWLFHGRKDRTVPVEESRRLYKALKSVRGNVKYSEYAGVGHEAWDAAYADPTLVPWLLEQKL